MRKYILFLLIVLCVWNSQIKCESKDILTVHLIPHSHDDYGWLSTIDQYFTQPSQFRGQGAVNDIINSVNSELKKDEKRKFIQVEIGFLNMWWQTKNELERQGYKDMIKSGQIEIINGGWTMHDEATPYFEDLIDQMTVGHLWVKDHLDGFIPTIGWQLDPFGHQSSNAALYSQMGFNAQWFARIDYQDKEKRKKEQSLEMIWSPPQLSKQSNYIFSAVNYQHYSPPKDFYFEAGDNVNDGNIVYKSQQFVNYFKEMKGYYRSNHLLHTMGEDFAYSRASLWYDGMDKLINYINARTDTFGMKIIYSTPSLYLEEINKENKQYPLNTHDFYPYADNENAYWTGYFTSRPSIKGFTKDSGRYLQAIRNIFAIENIQGRSKTFKNNLSSFIQSLEFFEQQVATMSHHDAITGTEKQLVANDYVKRLNEGYQKIRSHLHPLLQDYAYQDISESNIQYTQCNWNATITECDFTKTQFEKGNPVLVMIHNPSVKKQLNIRVKIPLSPVTIINEDNTPIAGDVICSNPQNAQDCDLYFTDIFEGYSYKYYKLLPQLGKDAKPIQPKRLSKDKEIIKIEISQVQSITIDTTKAQFTHSHWVEQKDEFIKQYKLQQNQFSIDYNYYIGKDSYGSQNSGAYIFRPTQNTSAVYSKIEKYNVYQGKNVVVIVLEGDKITTQLRIYANSQSIYEVETFVHSIDVSDNKGKEIVMLVSTDYINNEKFYTDSNGLELQPRKYNYRPTWDLKVNEMSSSNYYPIGAMIQLKNEQSNHLFTVVNDRSQGGTSLKSGQIEIMIHRRLLVDDGRGVGEALNERDNAYPNQGLTQKVRHYIVFEKQGDQLARQVQNDLDSSPLIFLSQTSSKIIKRNKSSNEEQLNVLQGNKNGYLRVYLRQFQDHYTLRLYNINEIENSEFKLDNNFEIVDELTLTCNQSKSNWIQKQMKWNDTNGNYYQPNPNQGLIDEIKTNVIKMKPMQLRVFKIIKKN